MDAAGKFGKALVFNGSNAMVTIPDAPSLRLTTAMTLEAWVNPSVVNSGWRDIIYKGNDNYYLKGSTPSGAPAIGITVGAHDAEAFAHDRASARTPGRSWQRHMTARRCGSMSTAHRSRVRPRTGRS